MLRHLLRIDNTNKISDIIWEVIEKIVYRATLFDRDENVIGGALERYADEKFKLLISETNKEKMQQQQQLEQTQLNEQILELKELPQEALFLPPAPAPPAPPPPPPLPPPPPPLLLLNFSQEPFRQHHHVFAKDSTQSGSKVQYESNSTDDFILPQQCVPKANTKMKQLIWSKIHPNRIIGKQNLWTKYKARIEEQLNDTDKNNMFFHEIEEYFKTSENPRAESQYKDPNLKETKVWNSSEKINLLDSKRSLNINIYLKQFRW